MAKQEQHYLYLGNQEPIPVSQDVYLCHQRWAANKRYRARRDGQCTHSDYRFCSGDCEHCRWWQDGFKMLPLLKVLGETGEFETPDFDNTLPTMDEIIAGKLMLQHLYQKLDALIPDGARVFQLRALHYSERDIAQELGIKSQSTLHYRIQKMDEFIRKHRDELEDLLR